MEQKQKPHGRSFVRELVPDWQPTRDQVMWAVRIVTVLVLLLGLLTLVGLPFKITLWEWLKLLIVPAVIAAGGLWFNRQQRDREMEIAEQRSQDEALQAYLDGMSQLLTDEKRPLHRARVGDSLSTVARARTLTILTRLDGPRKGSVLRFLYESGLITANRLILDLKNADLRKANLKGVFLTAIYLYRADLREANLQGTNLVGARLERANLQGANLQGARLLGTRLEWADLQRADLREAALNAAHLEGANLQGANLEDAILLDAHLRDADLRVATLKRALGFTAEELKAQAKSLKGTLMPNGQKYEDWLKSKGSGEG